MNASVASLGRAKHIYDCVMRLRWRRDAVFALWIGGWLTLPALAHGSTMLQDPPADESATQASSSTDSTSLVSTTETSRETKSEFSTSLATELGGSTGSDFDPPKNAQLEATKMPVEPAPAEPSPQAAALPSHDETPTRASFSAKAAKIESKPSAPAIDRTINIGVWLRIGTFLNDPDAPYRMNKLRGNGLLQLMLHGRVHKYIGWQAGLRGYYGGGTITNPVSLLDAIVKLEAKDQVINLWLGRMLVPSDRSNLSGPWFIAPWHYPGMYGGPNAVAVGPRVGTNGRDDGLVLWGQIRGGLLKYYAGLFNVHAADDDPLWSGRVVLNLLAPEPGYFNRSAYYGENRIALAVNYQYRRDGSVAPPLAQGRVARQAAYQSLSGEILLEQKFEHAGALTVEGALYNFSGKYETFRWHSYVLLSYLLPFQLGPGHLQPLVRYQHAIQRLAGAPAARAIDAQLAYVLDKNWLKLVIGGSHAYYLGGDVNQVYFGAQLMRN